MPNPADGPTDELSGHSGGGDHSGGPLLSPRAALVLLLAVLAGLGAGMLTVWSGRHLAEAVGVGVGAAAAAAGFFNWIIG